MKKIILLVFACSLFNSNLYAATSCGKTYASGAQSYNIESTICNYRNIGGKTGYSRVCEVAFTKDMPADIKVKVFRKYKGQSEERVYGEWAGRHSWYVATESNLENDTISAEIRFEVLKNNRILHESKRFSCGY